VFLQPALVLPRSTVEHLESDRDILPGVRPAVVVRDELGAGALLLLDLIPVGQVLDVIDVVGEPFDAVGGPTMGADALAHGVSVVSGCSWFSVRKEPKGHGRGAWIEGARLVEGDRVVIVEDVVSTGASLLKAVDKVAELGAVVVAATALLDRSPVVAKRFAAAGINWAPLLTWADIGIEPL